MMAKCESCGIEFKRQRGGKGRFCSRKCWGAAMKESNPSRLAEPSDFWAQIEKKPSGCWEWKGARNIQGYGILTYRRKAWLAHRLAYTFSRLVTPECVCHTCDNPSCCNPEHLFAGDRPINNADRHAKGRSRGGSMPGPLNPMFGKSRNANIRAAERVR